VARPERFELLAFWFAVEKAGNPNALQVPHLQAAPASKLLPQLVHARAGFMKRVHKPAMKRSPAGSPIWSKLSIAVHEVSNSTLPAIWTVPLGRRMSMVPSGSAILVRQPSLRQPIARRRPLPEEV